MRRIAVMNAKGGSGKTTVATHLASYYAGLGRNTVLFDADRQGSSMRWLEARGDKHPTVHGISGYTAPTSRVTRTWQLRAPIDAERVIVDTPAGLAGSAIVDELRGLNAVIIPVMPSATDIHATAAFLHDLFFVGRVQRLGIPVAIVANRVRTRTRSLQALEEFLAGLRVPVLAYIRDAQCYPYAAALGVAAHELASRDRERDTAPWQRIVDWLEAEMRFRPSVNDALARA